MWRDDSLLRALVSIIAAIVIVLLKYWLLHNTYESIQILAAGLHLVWICCVPVLVAILLLRRLLECGTTRRRLGCRTSRPMFVRRKRLWRSTTSVLVPVATLLLERDNVPVQGTVVIHHCI